MTGAWTPPPPTAIPPGAGFAPPPPMGPDYRSRDFGPEYGTEDDRVEDRQGWSFDDAEADRHKSTEELRKDAEMTRQRVNGSVLELRERLGVGPGTHGPFEQVRRHPFTVAVASVGAATAAVVGVTVARHHRRAEKNAARERMGGASALHSTARSIKRRGKATDKRRKAAQKAAGKRWDEAKDRFGSAASTAGKRSRKGIRHLTHR